MADDDDDPQLRSLRAAWRSMPDEEPPQRGLAELMAAARQKAEVMAHVPWWKKLAQALLRPPMLALASVLILLGGLFVVTSSHRGVSPEPTPVEHEQAPAATTPTAGDRGEAEGGRAATSAATGSALTIAPQSPTPEPAAAPALAAPPARSRAPAHHAAIPAPKPAERALDETPPAAQPAPPPPAPTPSAAPAYDSTDDAEAAPATRGPVKKTPAADVAREPIAPRQQLDDQLLAQCRAAAKRGDCEIAKQLAKRISNDDASYYRANVAGDATIAPCLAQ